MVIDVSDNPFKDWPVASEAARQLGVAVQTVYRYLKSGKLAGRDVSGGEKDARYRIDPASIAKLKAGKPCKSSPVEHVEHTGKLSSYPGDSSVNIGMGAELLHGQTVTMGRPPDNLTTPNGAD